MSDVRCLSVAYIGPNSRTENPRKTNIGTEVRHVTRDLDTTFKVKRSKVSLQGAGAYCGGLPHSLLILKVICSSPSVSLGLPMLLAFFVLMFSVLRGYCNDKQYLLHCVLTSFDFTQLFVPLSGFWPQRCQ